MNALRQALNAHKPGRIRTFILSVAMAVWFAAWIIEWWFA
jgi:hypothetical protein